MWLRAERQTDGRGRQGRTWESPPGNLFTSGLIRLRDGDPAPGTLAFVASLALYQTVSHCLSLLTVDDPEAIQLLLKWPNDLFLDGKKLSGILLEREADAIVIGVGVNLAHHPGDLDRPVTSLAAYGPAPSPDDFLADLAGRFSALLGGWRSHGPAPILANWLRHAHSQGSSLTVHDPSGEIMTGTFDGLTEEGALRLRLADGSVHVMHAGDVFLV